jgi:hypothetical protein
MLHMALATSSEISSPAIPTETIIALTDELLAGTPGSCHIQIWLPKCSRALRHVLESDLIGMINALVERELKDGYERQIDLRYGFPTKDLQSVQRNLREVTLLESRIHSAVSLW